MANTTRWEINKEKTGFTFESVAQKITGLSSKTLRSSTATYKDFYIEKNNGEDLKDKNLEEEFNGKKIIYNFFSIKFNRYLLGEVEATETKQLIILYEDNNKIYIIIDKNTGSKAFIRLILGFNEGKQVLQVSQVSNGVSSNLIIWLLYKVYSKEITFDLNTKNLNLDTIIGFKGKTDDKLNTITAIGDSLMNILSTLSFLLESNSLNQISLRLEYTNHRNIEIKLATNDTLGVSLESYKGAFKKDSYKDLSLLHKEALVFLLVYIEVFPIIKQWYSESIEDNEEIDSEQVQSKAKWGKIEHRNFLEQVAKDLTDKVDDKVAGLDKKISKL